MTNDFYFLVWPQKYGNFWQFQLWRPHLIAISGPKIDFSGFLVTQMWCLRFIYHALWNGSSDMELPQQRNSRTEIPLRRLCGWWFLYYFQCFFDSISMFLFLSTVEWNQLDMFLGVEKDYGTNESEMWKIAQHLRSRSSSCFCQFWLKLMLLLCEISIKWLITTLICLCWDKVEKFDTICHAMPSPSSEWAIVDNNVCLLNMNSNVVFASK